MVYWYPASCVSCVLYGCGNAVGLFSYLYRRGGENCRLLLSRSQQGMDEKYRTKIGGSGLGYYG